MKQNKTWLLAALALAVVLAGAGTLYGRLSGSVEADSLMPQTAGDQEAGEEADGASDAGTSKSLAGARRGWAGTHRAARPRRNTGCGRRCTGSGPPH